MVLILRFQNDFLEKIVGQYVCFQFPKIFLSDTEQLMLMISQQTSLICFLLLVFVKSKVEKRYLTVEMVDSVNSH